LSGNDIEFYFDSSLTLTVPPHLQAENDSPLCCAEVLLKSVADAQLYPQIPANTGVFETPG